MANFVKWCHAPNQTPIAGNTLEILVAISKKISMAIGLVAASLPEHYADKRRLAGILRKLGRNAAAERLESKLPTTKQVRSGDLGEILCTSFIREKTIFNYGVNRLRWKDHRNMAMRGDDVLAFSIDSRGMKFLKAEAKSRVAMNGTVLSEARTALSANNGLPTAHAISFVADQAGSEGNYVLQDAIDVAQLKKGIKPTQVTHMLFTFSGNDAENLLKNNLTAYSGQINQHYVGLQLTEHQSFIQQVFESVKV